MKKLATRFFFFISVVLFVSLRLNAQGQCGTRLDLSWIQNNDPALYQRIQDLENQTNAYANSQNLNSSRLINSNGLIIIPVVVHVLYNTISQNISDAQIQSQIAVLNEDYRRLNADRVNTPNDFLASATDYNIEFRLACIDPNGNPTNGVVRKYTGAQSFIFSQDPRGYAKDEVIGIKSSPNGDEPWPTDRYLNIWVCNISGVVGYGTWPVNFLDRPQYDGVVITTAAFGRLGNSAPLNLGRTATHEIGHWLNLKHLNDGNQGCADDLVGDTPRERFVHDAFSNWTYPELTGRCDLTDPSTMFMNFMEYSSDDLMNLFTNGQKLRSRAVFATVNGVANPRVSQLNNFFGFAGQPTSISCKGNITVSPICLPVTWTVTGPATISSGSGSNQIELTATGNGTVHLVATSGNYTAETDVTVTIGNPPYVAIDISSNGNYSELPTGSTNLSDYNSVCNYQDVNLNMYVTGATSVSWSKVSSNPGNIYWQQTGNNLSLYFYNVGQSALFRITASNSCGTATKDYGFKSIDCSGGGGCDVYLVSSNPASESVDIIVPNIPPPPCDLSVSALAQIDITEVTIYDQTGTMKKKLKYAEKTKKVNINLNGLRTGIYFFEIGNKTHKERKQIIVTK